MQRDGRGFDHRTLEAIRLMAVERVLDGERPSSVIASFGSNRTTIYRWLEVASKPGAGLSALRSRPATGRPRSLTPRQAAGVSLGQRSRSASVWPGFWVVGSVFGG